MYNLDLALTGIYYVSGLLVIFFLTLDSTSERYLISDKAEAYLFTFSAVNQYSLKFK